MENRIKEIREQKLMTQEELAEKTGLSRTSISKIENNRSMTLRMSTINSLATALGVSPLALFIA